MADGAVGYAVRMHLPKPKHGPKPNFARQLKQKALSPADEFRGQVSDLRNSIFDVKPPRGEAAWFNSAEALLDLLASHPARMTDVALFHDLARRARRVLGYRPMTDERFADRFVKDVRRFIAGPPSYRTNTLEPMVWEAGNLCATAVASSIWVGMQRDKRPGRWPDGCFDRVHEIAPALHKARMCEDWCDFDDDAHVRRAGVIALRALGVGEKDAANIMVNTAKIAAARRARKAPQLTAKADVSKIGVRSGDGHRARGRKSS